MEKTIIPTEVSTRGSFLTGFPMATASSSCPVANTIRARSSSGGPMELAPISLKVPPTKGGSKTTKSMVREKRRETDFSSKGNLSTVKKRKVCLSMTTVPTRENSWTPYLAERQN